MRKISDAKKGKAVQAEQLCNSAGRLARLLALAVAVAPWMLCATVSSGKVAAAQAQARAASLNGVIVDNGGYAVAGVDVALEDVQSQHVLHIVSDNAGSFAFKALTPGQYKLQATKDGYKIYLIRTLTVAPGSASRASIQMQVGSPIEVVEGSVTAIASASGVSGKELGDVPENQRNFVNVAQMTVGANEGTTNVADSTEKAGTQHNSSAISVAGQLDRLNNNMVNGVDNSIYQKGIVAVHPSVDAIGEMQVFASTLPASEGNAAGGVINIKTKAGTKKFHGGIFEYFRNDAIDAHPYMFGAQRPKPEVRQNQFGGSFGGPIWKKTTTLYVDYEGFRLIQARPPQTLTVPTQYEHDHPGDFTDVGGKNYTAAGSYDPVGMFYFKLFPAPNSGTSQYVASPRGQNYTNAIDARIDHEITPRDKMYAFISYNHMNLHQLGNFPNVTEGGMTLAPGGGQLDVFGVEDNPTEVYGLNYTHTFGKSLSMNLIWGQMNFRDTMTQLNSATAVNAALGQPGINTPLTSNGLAPISVTKATIIGDAGYYDPYNTGSWNTTYKGNLEWRFRKQKINVGGGIIRKTWSDYQSEEGLGYWSVADLPNLVQGTFTSVIRNVALDNPHYQFSDNYLYGQDEFNLTPHLHVSLGVRYDVLPAMTEQHNQLANFDLDTGKIVIAGQNGVSRSAGVQTDYTGVTPRIGFDWALNSTTSVRGGFGIVVRNMASIGSEYNMPPFAYTYGPCSSSGQNNVAACPGYNSLSAGLPAPVIPATGTISGSLENARAKNMKNMSLDLINFGADHVFSKYDTAHVFYVGTLGRHVTRIFYDANAPAPNNASNPNLLRPYYSIDPNMTSVQYADSEGSSNYDALQASYQHNTRFGVTAQMNYTLAHAMDNARTWGSDATGYGNVISEAATRDYGNSVLDVRNRIVSNIKYDLPFGKSATGYRKTLEKGWQFNVAEVWSTGLPFTVLNASDVSNTNPGATNTTSDRPNVSGQVNLSSKSPSKFFNTTAFTAQTVGTLGDERRNQYYGPHSRHVDVSLFKNFSLLDDLTGQFRVETFNVTNTSNFAAPARYLNGPNFGKLTQITSGYTPREIQAAFRIQF
jgi:hypothetical protein